MDRRGAGRGVGGVRADAVTLAASGPVVGRSGQDRRGAVELFGQHHPHQHMRPDHRPEPKHQIGPLAQGWINPIGAANDKSRVLPPTVPPRGEDCREIGAGQLLAAFVQHAQGGTIRHGAGQKSALSRLAAAAFVFNLMFRDRAQTKRPSGPVQTVQIIVNQRPFGPGPQATDSAKLQAHQPCAVLVAGIDPVGSHIFSSW